MRDNRLFFALEEILADVILADASDYGVDLAVSKVFPSYQPGSHRWEQFLYLDVHWITCETEAIVGQPSRTAHINLLDGTLRVNGQLLGGLTREIKNSPKIQQIFSDVRTCCNLWYQQMSLILIFSKASLSYHPISQEWISRPSL